VLRAVHTGRADLATALERARRKLTDPRDRALAGEIVLGVERQRAALDHYVEQAATRPLSAITPAALDLLRAGGYQLLFLDRIPAHAAVADAVELARETGVGRAAGFLNAVLRTLSDRRRPLKLPAAPEIEPPGALRAERKRALDYLATTLSHPRWLVERWLDRHGFANAETWARFDNAPAPVTLRANLARNDVDELRAVLEAQGVRTDTTRLAPHGLVVLKGDPLSTPAAAEGRFLVQEEASQLIVELASPAPQSRVLDLCAAPGGKTVGLAGCTGPDGLVIAADCRPRRVAVLKRFLTRMQSVRAPVVRLDATAPLPFDRAFDCVLVDAPCSGLGALRSDPDIRWRRAPDDLPRFAAAQFAMLCRASETVRPGGRLVYATCSSEPEENDEVVSRFRDAHPEYQLAAPLSDSGIERVVDGDGYLRTLPFRHGVEAFFGAVLVRRAR
jgi:16S rRNA (cytosine967-C5)-methyltransferase